MNFTQFIIELKKLKNQYPVIPTHNLRSENSELGDYLISCHNVYYSFDNAQCKDSVYLFDSFKAVNCIDGDYVIESENCYECVDVLRAYNCSYLNYCARIYDSHYCTNCYDSDHLFGCSNLKFKKFCIFNKQYSEEEYNALINKFANKPFIENLHEMNKITGSYPVTITHVDNSENCDYGNQIFYSKNLYLSFDSSHSEDGGYLYDAHHNKNCYDLTQSFHCADCYECVDCARLNKCFYIINSEDVYDSALCENCSNSNNLFGCINLDKKEYCILNKQYSKEEYNVIIDELMKSFQVIGSGNISS